MPTDIERREAARRLREKKAEYDERGYPWMCDDLILALGYDHDYEAGDEIFDRLADLIEPPLQCPYYHSDRHYCLIHDVPTIDRDALLELADDVDSDADNGMGGTFLRYYARRIREALGEVE